MKLKREWGEEASELLAKSSENSEAAVKAALAGFDQRFRDQAEERAKSDAMLRRSEENGREGVAESTKPLHRRQKDVEQLDSVEASNDAPHKKTRDKSYLDTHGTTLLPELPKKLQKAQLSIIPDELLAPARRIKQPLRADAAVNGESSHNENDDASEEVSDGDIPQKVKRDAKSAEVADKADPPLVRRSHLKSSMDGESAATCFPNADGSLEGLSFEEHEQRPVKAGKARPEAISHNSIGDPPKRHLEAHDNNVATFSGEPSKRSPKDAPSHAPAENSPRKRPEAAHDIGAEQREESAEPNRTKPQAHPGAAPDEPTRKPRGGTPTHPPGDNEKDTEPAKRMERHADNADDAGPSNDADDAGPSKRPGHPVQFLDTADDEPARKPRGGTSAPQAAGASNDVEPSKRAVGVRGLPQILMDATGEEPARKARGGTSAQESEPESKHVAPLTHSEQSQQNHGAGDEPARKPCAGASMQPTECDAKAPAPVSDLEQPPSAGIVKGEPARRAQGKVSTSPASYISNEDEPSKHLRQPQIFVGSAGDEPPRKPRGKAPMPPTGGSIDDAEPSKRLEVDGVQQETCPDSSNKEPGKKPRGAASPPRSKVDIVDDEPTRKARGGTPVSPTDMAPSTLSNADAGCPQALTVILDDEPTRKQRTK